MGNLTKQIQPNDYKVEKDTPTLAKTMKGISYTYDSMNRSLTTVLPEGTVQLYLKYDVMGNVTKKVDGLRYNGNLETSPGNSYKYDGLGNVIQTTDALGNSKSFEYNVLSSLTKTTDEKGNITRYDYNADGTLAKVIYANNGEIEYTYDLMGRKIALKDQLENITTYAYNSFGSIKQEMDAYNKTVEYRTDLIGNIVAAKNKNGSTIYNTYDAANRLVKKRLPLEKDGSGNVIYYIENYTYNELGNITRKESTGTKDKLSSREINYTYYDNGLVNTVSDSSGAYSKYYYDQNGNAIKTDNLRSEGVYDIQKFEYDSMNRLQREIKLVDEADIYNAASLPDVGNLYSE